MKITYSYACCDYPGMDDCPGRFVAGSRDEVWKLVELHAATAHGEDPAQWDKQTRESLQALIKSS